MCHKLVQTYACNHSKDICTTPCPHALALSNPRPQTAPTSIARSNSTVSSIAPSSYKAAAGDSPAPSMKDVSPLPAVSQRPEVHSQPKVSPLLRIFPRPAFRFKVDNAPAPPVSPGSSYLETALSDNTEEIPHAQSAPSAQPAQPVQPVYCAYYFPRYLTQSRYPCRECYMRPEWEDMRKAWVENYQLGHPMDRAEDLERLAGVNI